MKAAVHTGPGVIEYRDVPEPTPGPGEIKVHIEYAGICGSDVEIVFERFGMQKLDSWPKGPRIEGHEAVGVITELGPDVKQDYAVGQRVGLGFRAGCGVCYYCRNGLEHFCQYEKQTTGTWAEYAVFPEGAVFPLPDSIPSVTGALVEPMSIAVHLIDLACIKTGQSLLITGAGPIGLLCLAVARQAGAAKIVVSEPKAAKREVALRMGADAVIDPLADGGVDLAEASAKLTGGKGFHAVIEASGNLQAAAAVPNAAARGGTIVWGAVYPDEAEVGVRPYLMYEKELTIKGAWLAPYSFYRAIDLLAKLDLSEIITDIYPLEETQAAFDNHLRGESIKTLLKCS